MIPYFWGDTPIGAVRGTSGVTFSSLLRNDLGLYDLPEDVRAAIEQRTSEIRSAEDLEAMVTELMIKQ